MKLNKNSLDYLMLNLPALLMLVPVFTAYQYAAVYLTKFVLTAFVLLLLQVVAYWWEPQKFVKSTITLSALSLMYCCSFFLMIFSPTLAKSFDVAAIVIGILYIIFLLVPIIRSRW